MCSCGGEGSEKENEEVCKLLMTNQAMCRATGNSLSGGGVHSGPYLDERKEIWSEKNEREDNSLSACF